MTYFHDHSDNRGKTFAFAAVWIAVGLLLFLGSVHQAFASRSPESVVVIEPSELTPGQAIRLRVVQPGPLRLLSLHANLGGEDRGVGTGIVLARLHAPVSGDGRGRLSDLYFADSDLSGMRG